MKNENLAFVKVNLFVCQSNPNISVSGKKIGKCICHLNPNITFQSRTWMCRAGGGITHGGPGKIYWGRGGLVDKAYSKYFSRLPTDLSNPSVQHSVN